MILDNVQDMSGTVKRIDGDRKPLQVWLSGAEREQLLALAEQERRSMAAQVRHLIADAVEKEAA